ncbi:MAG: nuclear transport factor 2 family protein [Saonia sp.]
MISNKRKMNIIQNYINSYNEFDIDGMIKDLDPEIVFMNISNGKTDFITNGIIEFKNQAEKATSIFSEREQKISESKTNGNIVEIGIHYFAILNIDLPNGLKKGENLSLKGKSVFKFNDEKIVEIRDIS